jgi:hypothetical protein
VNDVAGRTLHVGGGRGRLLAWAGGLDCCGPRNKRQLVAVYGGYPEELKLRKENQRRRDHTWNRLPMQTSHVALQNPLKNGVTIMMPNEVGRLQMISCGSYFGCSDLMQSVRLATRR